MNTRILVVDDDASLRRIIEFKLTQRGYRVTAAANGEEAVAALRSSRFDIVLTDMRMPGMNGLALLEAARSAQPQIEVILMTAFAEISQAVQAVKSGAFDYLTKPFDDDQLLIAIEKAVKLRDLEDENLALKERLLSPGFARPMIGVSAAFKAMMDLIDKVAQTDATVLITGESGTGKELVARTIHTRSSRRDHEFVPVNCAAIPSELIESELFGHVRGAFTGAIKDKKGKFELADGGTLLLDEVSELGGDLQAKLLRVVQERIVEPVGSEQRRAVDVRLIAATNVDLKERVESGRFREDLYYRLHVVPLPVPSLRDRSEDIPLLVESFLDKHAPGRSITVAPELMNAFREHIWPGNIRELENLMERLVILRKSDHLTRDQLPSDFLEGESSDSSKLPGSESGHVTFHEAERLLIENALKRFAGNKAKASQYLKIPRHVLLYRMKKYRIDSEQFRPEV